MYLLIRIAAVLLTSATLTLIDWLSAWGDGGS